MFGDRVVPEAEVAIKLENVHKIPNMAPLNEVLERVQKYPGAQKQKID